MAAFDIPGQRLELVRAFHCDAGAIFADLLQKQAADANAGKLFLSFAPRLPEGWRSAMATEAAS